MDARHRTGEELLNFIKPHIKSQAVQIVFRTTHVVVLLVAFQNDINILVSRYAERLREFQDALPDSNLKTAAIETLDSIINSGSDES